MEEASFATVSQISELEAREEAAARGSRSSRRPGGSSTLTGSRTGDGGSRRLHSLAGGGGGNGFGSGEGCGLRGGVAGQGSVASSLLSGEFGDTEYWRSWVGETTASASLASRAKVARRVGKKKAKEQATQGLKGVKLAVQWEWDHPFARRDRFGKGRSAAAVLDTEERRFFELPRGYFSELPELPPAPPPKGVRLSSTGRLDMERLYLGKEHNKHYIEPSDVGPGSYDVKDSCGPQVLSTKRSMPAFSVTAVDRSNLKQYQTDSPGPGYLPKASPLVYGHTPAFRFTTATDRGDPPVAAGHETPGAKYHLPEPAGKGPAFSFGRSTSKGVFADEDGAPGAGDDDMPDPDDPAATLARPVPIAPAGFGFGCSYEEHVKWGMCLDGRCSHRSLVEQIARREVEVDKSRRKRATEQLQRSQSAPLAIVPGASTATPTGVRSGSRTGRSARGSDGGAPRLATRGSTRSLFRPNTAVHSDLATARTTGEVARFQTALELPNLDVFPHTCLHCGRQVSLLSREERIRSINRRVSKNHSHLIRTSFPGKKFKTGDRLEEDDAASYAESLQSTAMAPAPYSVVFTPRSTSTVDPLESRAVDWPPPKPDSVASSARSRGSGPGRRARRQRGRNRRGKHSGAAPPSTDHDRRGSARSSRSSRSGVTEASRSVGRHAPHRNIPDVEHDPSKVTYLPGCGFFCSDEHVKAFTVANVGPQKGGAKSTTNQPRKAVFFLAEDGRMDEMSELLRNGSDIQITAEGGMNALHIAAKNGRVYTIDRLLCGAFNVLRYQVCRRHHPTGCSCYNQNIDVNATTNDGSTALHLAAQAGHEVAVERLLRAGANSELLDHRGQAAHDVAGTQGTFNLCRNATTVADVSDQVRDVHLRNEHLIRELQGS